MNFIKLPSSGVLIDVEKVLTVVRQDINKYAVVLFQCPTCPVIDGVDYEILTTFVGAAQPEAPPAPAPRKPDIAIVK